MRYLVTSCLVLCLACVAAFSGGTTFWQMDTFSDFARGSFTGVSLSREGRLSLAPRLEEVFSTGEALVWATAEDSLGNVYLGTGHSGKVFRLDAKTVGPDVKSDAKARVFFDAPEPDVFALAVDRRNNMVYVGTSPDGKVYKLLPDGKAQEFCSPQSKYIWSLAIGGDGTVYVGTGDRGRIYRVTPEGKGELFFDTRQAHVMSLAVAPDQSLVAGSEPNGLLYRILPSGRGMVLYDAPLAEIHSVAVAPDGSVFASAIAAGASRGRGIGAANAELISAAEGAVAPVTITVQAAPAPGNEDKDDKDKKDKETKEKDKDKTRDGREAAERGAREAVPPPVPAVDFAAGTRSAIYRVAPDRTVETLWTSREESVYDILPSADGLLFSTDERGRIYRLNSERQTTLVVQTNEEQTTRLLRPAYNAARTTSRDGSAILAATSNFGKLFRLGATPAERGWYESPVKDSRSISRWGKLSWRAEMPQGTRVEFLTRGGNSSTPDQTWSDWEPATAAAAAGERGDLHEARIATPAARYLQWKVIFHPPAGKSPTLEDVTVAYLPQNRAPSITSVTVTPSLYNPAARGAVGSSPAPPAASSPTEPMVVIVDDTAAPTGKAASSQVITQNAPPGTPPGPRAGAMQSTMTISWQAEDPDGDRLFFRIYLRGEGETEWKLLKDNVRETTLQLEPESLADGKYQVRVVASDAEANPRDTARTAEYLSAPFLIDNTPPVVRVVQQRRTGASAEVRFEAADAASVLRRAEYAVDGGAWTPVYSEDGIIDSRMETFVIRLDSLAPGEHVIGLRVYDSGNNAGIGKAVLK